MALCSIHPYDPLWQPNSVASFAHIVGMLCHYVTGHLPACGPMCESHIMGPGWPERSVEGTSASLRMVALDGVCSI